MDTKTTDHTLAKAELVKASLADPKGNFTIMAYNSGKLITLLTLNLITPSEYHELDEKYGTDSALAKNE